MLKKILAAALSVILMASFSVTVLAAPDDTDTATPPTTGALPHPSESPKPSAEPNPFILQVKAMRGEVDALKGLLASERAYDRQVRDAIKEILNIVKLDGEKVKAYTEQIKALTNELKRIKKNLMEVRKKKPVDQAKVDELLAAKKVAEDKITALKTTSQTLIDQMKGNRFGSRTMKPLHDLLKPKYEALKPLVKDAEKLNADIRKLTKDLKDALKAGDQDRAKDLVEQIRAKVGLLKDNLNARITIRLEMKNVLDEFKAKLLAEPAPAAPSN